MTIEITVDDSFSPENASIKVNGIDYKQIKGLQLRISGDSNGSLTIEHESGYIEAYKAESPKEQYE